ncbi:MAG: acyl-[ACP]--phospholipid O-acyltransferase [Pseudomonadota bacterium]
MLKLFANSAFRFFVPMVFLNAFVDLGHKIIIQNTIFKLYDGGTQVALTAVVNALILLPFVLLLSPSGFLSDKYPRARVMQFSAWAAIVLTTAITFCYYQGWFWAAFSMTFLLAVQSAFYSPAKFAYIKDLVGNRELTDANALIQATSTIAILAGTLVFSMLFENRLAGVPDWQSTGALTAIAPLGWLLVLGTLAEVYLAYRLPSLTTANVGEEFQLKAYARGTYLHRNLKTIRSNEQIWLSIIGLAIFWSIAQVLLAAYPSYVEETMGVVDTVPIQAAMACAGIGLMLGSCIASMLSRGRIETGLIAIGAFGVAASACFIPLFDSLIVHSLAFVGLGTLGAMFIVPLNALIQFHAKPTERSKVLAANNFVQNLVMLGFLALTVVSSYYGIDSRSLLMGMVGVAILGAMYCVYKAPQSLVRFIIGDLFGLKYRLQVVGFDRVPEQGGVLLLGNHVSWIDWAIMSMASPRPVRFVMARAIYEKWYLRWFLDFFGCIPIAPGNYKDALSEVSRLLDEGEVVCLFPEGTLSRTGHLTEFKRGYEQAVIDTDAVIVPFYLRGLWGSTFSHSNEGLRSARKTGRKRDLVVAFGSALPKTTDAIALKQAVFELSIEAWDHYSDSLPTIPQAWLETAKRNSSELAITDSVGSQFSNHRVLVSTLLLSREIAKFNESEAVGLLLPTSSAGAIANMAVLLQNKTVVNLNYSSDAALVADCANRADINHVISSRRFVKQLEKRGFLSEAVFQGRQVLYMEDFAAQLSTAKKLSYSVLCKILPGYLLEKLFCRATDPTLRAAILFSSGSEGTPKGIELSHRNLMSNLKQISDVLNAEANDSFMNCLPLFPAFVLTATTLLPMVEGIPMVTHPDPTDAAGTAKAIARYRATILCGTSTFLRLYVRSKKVQPLMLESLRLVVAGAEKLSNDVREQFKLKFNKDIYEGYGATETSPVASVNVPDELDVGSWRLQRGGELGSVGMPLPGTSFRIVDPETLETLPSEEAGLILIGGNQVMLGYLNNDAKTDDVIVQIDDKRWYKTGDKGKLDEHGFLHILDRYSRFAKIGGEMISLGSAETLAEELAGNADMQLTAVALPDDKKGEKVVLLYTGSDVSPAELKQKYLDAGISNLLIPSRFIPVGELPLLGSGKVDFRRSKELAMEHLAL